MRSTAAPPEEDDDDDAADAPDDADAATEEEPPARDVAALVPTGPLALDAFMVLVVPGAELPPAEPDAAVDPLPAALVAEEDAREVGPDDAGADEAPPPLLLVAPASPLPVLVHAANPKSPTHNTTRPARIMQALLGLLFGRNSAASFQRARQRARRKTA